MKFFSRPAPLWAILLTLAIALPASAASAVIFYGSVVLPAYSAGNPASSTVNIHNDNGATNGMVFNVPTGSTNGYQWQVNGSNVATMTPAGEFSPTSLTGSIGGSPALTGAGHFSTAFSKNSSLAPLYDGTGTLVTSATLHTTVLTCSIAQISGGCLINFSGASVFSSTTSYACAVSGTPDPGTINEENSTTGQVIFGWVANSGPTINVYAICYGT
jgi:hypothetical protein